MPLEYLLALGESREDRVIQAGRGQIDIMPADFPCLVSRDSPTESLRRCFANDLDFPDRKTRAGLRIPAKIDVANAKSGSSVGCG